MSRIAIATDSNSGITQAQGKELGIFVLPMPFYINDELFLEDITLSQEQFYQRLAEDADVKTTQPAPGDVIELWDKILKDYDQVVYIPMSSGLSSTCETAEMLSEDYGGKVQVVNNQRISVTQRQSALDALAPGQISPVLEENGTYLVFYKVDPAADEDTMDYLGQALAAGQLSQWAETASVSFSQAWGSWDDVACCARCEALEFPVV